MAGRCLKLAPDDTNSIRFETRNQFSPKFAVRSLPFTRRHQSPFEPVTAAGTPSGVFPWFDAVQRRYRTAQFDGHPLVFGRTTERQPAVPAGHGGGQTERAIQLKSRLEPLRQRDFPGRHAQPHGNIVQRGAVAAMNGLHAAMHPLIGTAGYDRPEPAARTLEKIAATHVPEIGSAPRSFSAPCRRRRWSGGSSGARRR